MEAMERLAAVVNCLSAGKEAYGVTTISKTLGLNKTSTYRLLSALKDMEWVEQDPDSKRYRLGSGLLQIGLSAISQLDLRSVSIPHMNKLAEAVHESVVLSLRVGLERMYIEQLQSSSEIRHVVELGRRFPLWNGAPGKAMLAFLETDMVEQVLDGLARSKVRTFASGQPIIVEALRDELPAIRGRGYALSSGERVLGTSAVAAPVFGQFHRVVGAVSVSGPLPRFTVKLANGYAPAVVQTARTISLQLGDAGNNP